MLKTRIIPVLLLKEGRVVKGKQFQDFRDVGDPVSAVKIYNAQNADELVLLDIEASSKNKSTLIEIVKKISYECFMPFSVGGGIKSVQDIRELLKAGADKVVITTSAVEDPDLICDASQNFGSQCVVVGVDVKNENGNYLVYTHSANVRTKIELIEHIRNMERCGAGEFFINSIDRDGMMKGYDLELAEYVKNVACRPIILCGGAGNFTHLVEAIKIPKVHAVACASLFHFGDNNPIRARSHIKNHGVKVKNIK
jgi:imidazole glycerol-phosphate synthase subunit HisF